jgi:hypothetical protein
MSKFIVLTMAVVAAAVLADTSGADPPAHARFPLSISEPSPEYSAACGFPVLIGTNGIVDVTVHTNPDGSIRTSSRV